jgi:hypothetical protein
VIPESETRNPKPGTGLACNAAAPKNEDPQSTGADKEAGARGRVGPGPDSPNAKGPGETGSTANSSNKRRDAVVGKGRESLERAVRLIEQTAESMSSKRQVSSHSNRQVSFRSPSRGQVSSTGVGAGHERAGSSSRESRKPSSSKPKAGGVAGVRKARGLHGEEGARREMLRQVALPAGVPENTIPGEATLCNMNPKHGAPKTLNPNFQPLNTEHATRNPELTNAFR